jgi:hypothetical protein|tara:strand:+ start:550 stop:735 length:186 start_codon:yes stop_codon:yes gene_type:complete
MNDMMAKEITALFGGLMAGLAVSSFKHYYHMFAEGQDRTKIDQYEVIVVEDKTKTTRRKKS